MSILNDSFLKKYKNLQPKWGFDGLGYIVYKRTYARPILDTNNKTVRTEEWFETIKRCIDGAQKLGAEYSQEEAERLFDYIFNLKCSFSGRGLWQLGTKTLDIVGADSLLNCWVTKVSAIEDFCFIFTESMLGGGVGAVISREYIHELPRVKSGVKCEFKNTKDADFIVPDSKEGWCELWRRILEAYLITGKSFTYSTICIRSSGESLKTFGGIAPGPKPLIDGTKELCRILEKRANKKLRTQDVADIICCGGQLVKSGGVRRTALILLGDVDDMAFLQLKRWDLGDIPNYRSNSNNTLLCSNYEHILDKYWDGFRGNGEPYGLANLKNCKKFGRTGEEKFGDFDLHDDSIIGLNPCAEACLADKESCNLAELFINNISSKEEMLDCAKLLYKTQKAIAAAKYLHEDTNKIVHKNMRLGLGVTGVCQRLDVVEEWCDFTYKGLRAFDKKYSKEKGIPQSIRLTVVKPSGTLSLLGGATPGVHPGYATYHTRRVRFSANDPLLQVLRDAGYNVVPEIQYDGTLNHDTLVVSFPCRFSEQTVCEDKLTVTDQLERLKLLQACWADQAVSNTIYFKIEDIPTIKKWLEKNYNICVKSVSFLLHSGHGFKQSPLEPTTKEQYLEAKGNIKPIDLTGFVDTGNEIQESLECAGGACPLK